MATCRILVFGLGLAIAAPAAAFPPYRSTDAETADPWTIEARLGLVRLNRDRSANAFSLPLWRLNLGLPFRLELQCEGEWDATAGRLGDAAAGLKAVPLAGPLSIGVEVMALLPISSAGGSGVEAQLLATRRWETLFVHLNGGGFYDARVDPREKGWRASALAEAPLGRWRPGLELFVRQINGGDLEPSAGAGVIVGLGPIDVRTGLHVGLTSAPTDLRASLWISTKLPLR
jgi:hypothetical protein